MKQDSLKDFLPIFEKLKQNSFDLKETVKNLEPQDIAPVFSAFSSAVNKNAPINNYESEKVNISSFADSEIVNALNSYLGANIT